jgi:colicin import membrane protein
MSLGSARRQFVEAAAPSTAEDVGAGLAFVAQMLADPKRVAAMAAQAATAQGVIDRAEKVTADLEALQRETDAKVAATAAELERLRRAHEQATAADRKKIDADRAAAEIERRAAAADRKAAAELLAEHRRRIMAAERAMAGA